MKNLFITGATGFIGSYIAEEFIRQNWCVTALIHKRNSERLEALSSKGKVKFVHGDIGDFESLQNALISNGKRFDAIIHCAGRASDVGWKREFRRINLDSVRYLVRLTKELNIERFVFVSTTDVYGLRDFRGEAEDDLELKPYPKNPYPEFKILAEKYIKRELPEDGFSIIRPAQVWGVGDTTLTARIVDFLNWSPWIVHFGKWRGGNRWPLAHVRNVATAAYLAVTSQAASGQAINVADSEYTTIDEFYRIIARIYLPDKRIKTVTLPFWVGYIAGAAISLISNLLNLQVPFMDPSLYALYAVSRNLDFNNKRLLALFESSGRKMISIEEGIQELKHTQVRVIPF
jgi:nucleoside-diphosphate-sugar epimerase